MKRNFFYLEDAQLNTIHRCMHQFQTNGIESIQNETVLEPFQYAPNAEKHFEKHQYVIVTPRAAQH